jgi:regulator of RNase E activity RraB
MTNDIWIYLFVVAIAVGFILYRASLKGNTTKDALVIEQLAKAGSDLHKPHNIDFFFYFPTELAARNAEKKLSALGMTIEVGRSAHDESVWSLQATRSIVPDRNAIEAMRAQFDEIAKAENGEYDGWGTEVVPRT